MSNQVFIMEAPIYQEPKVIKLKPNKAIFRSLAVNSLFDDLPIKELTTAKTNSNKATYAQPE